MLYVLSAKPAFKDMISAALKARISASAETTAGLMSHLLEGARSKFDIVFVDLTDAPEIERFVEFIKASGALSSIKIVLVGAEPQLLALSAATTASVDGLLRAPCNPIEIAAIVERIRPPSD